MEVEDIRCEFEAAKAVKSSAEMSQFPNFSQYEANELRADAEVSDAVNKLGKHSLLSVQPPVGCENFAESKVLEANEDSRKSSSRSTISTPVESGSEKSVRYSALETRREFENTVNTVRSQTRAQLTTFDPTEYEAMPASVYVVSAAAPGVVQSKRGNAYHRLDDEVLVRAGASSQPVRETPRQPHGLSLVDPEAPTRFFGRSGQRQVTIAQSDKGLPRALISGDASKWIWSSIDQLDEAVSELVRGSNSRPSSSQVSLSAVNVEAEELSQSAVDAGQQNSAVSLPTDPVTGQPQSSVYQWGKAVLCAVLHRRSSRVVTWTLQLAVVLSFQTLVEPSATRRS